MSPDVLDAKLELLTQVLTDLKPHITESSKERHSAHYEIERQVQLAIDLCVAIARRMLLLRGIVSPASARDAFSLLAEKKMIGKELSVRLAQAVGLRNLIVHEYGKIDYDLLFSGLPDGYRSFLKFAQTAQKLLEQKR